MGKLTEISTQTYERALKKFRVIDDYNPGYFRRYLNDAFRNESTSGMAKNKVFRILRDLDASYETGREKQYYLSLYNDCLKTEKESRYSNQKRLFVEILSDLCENYAAPEEYVRRIVDAKQEPEILCDNDSLRLRILKQFLYKAGGLADTKISGIKYIREFMSDHAMTSVTDLDDTVFSVLEAEKACPESELVRLDEKFKEELLQELEKSGFNDSKYRSLTISDLEAAAESLLGEKSVAKARALRNRREKEERNRHFNASYSLLIGCDELAKGLFRKANRSKEFLYWFAMAFGLTYGKSDSFLDVDHMFSDIYTCNLLSWKNEELKTNKAAYDLDPGENGINYKNPLEVINLYCIRRDDLSPMEKIKLAGFLRKELDRTRKTSAEHSIPNKQTQEYQRDVTGRILKASSDKEFIRALAEEYGTVGSMPTMSYGKEQMRAYEYYEDIWNGWYDQRQLAGKKFGKNEGFVFADVMDAIGAEMHSPSCSEEERKRLQNMYDVLTGLRNYLGPVTKNDEPKALQTNPKNKLKEDQMTRATVMTVFYYNWILETDELHESFSDFYAEFVESLNDCLEDCGYSCVTGKSLFDLLIIMSAYLYEIENN